MRRHLPALGSWCLGAALALFALFSLPAAAGAAPAAGRATPSPLTFSTSREALSVTGHSNLSAGTSTASPQISAPGTPRRMPLMHPSRPGGNPGGGRSGPSSSPIVAGATPDTLGWTGVTGPAEAPVQGYHLEPPDQGLCAGPGGRGQSVVVEYVNNVLQVFTPTGTALTGIISATKLLALPNGTFLSDPRCYFDAQTQRWFFTEFVSGTKAAPTSTQYIAVSQTPDPLGGYTVFGYDTTDASNTAAGCPCFGDFDQLGADQNGIYIATNEFNEAGTVFNGVDLWAVSKQLLVAAADSSSNLVIDRYAVTQDAFGQPYHVSPASTPADGGYAPNTEYFVESNSDANADDHLLVYSLSGTSVLGRFGFPRLQSALLSSEPYSFPPNATQRPGGSDPSGTLQADFNAVQEVTESNGLLYAELDTGVGSTGLGPDEIGWFTLGTGGQGAFSASLLDQGYVANARENLLYPMVAVDGSGHGYLLFSVSGPDVFPSPGYVPFEGIGGPRGVLHLPAQGVDDENGFTCFPPFTGGCRWGDYSMGVAFRGTVFMATEYVPIVKGDGQTNWGTFIWGSPSLLP